MPSSGSYLVAHFGVFLGGGPPATSTSAPPLHSTPNYPAKSVLSLPYHLKRTTIAGCLHALREAERGRESERATASRHHCLLLKPPE